MRHFLYLDTDIVNSIIAQQEKGIIDAITTENENGINNNRTKSVDIESSGEVGANVWKLANAEARLRRSNVLS